MRYCLYIDAGTFVTDLLGPVVTQVRKVTSPLEPIVDFVQAEVPVLTQLSEMVGKDPVTVLTLIKESGGFNDEQIALVYSVLQFIQLANKLPDNAGVGDLFIPLGESGPGSFSLFGEKLVQGSTTPDQAETLINKSDPNYKSGSNLAAHIPGATSGGTTAADDHDPRPTTFGVKGLSFPFLNEGSEIFGLLLGKDVRIVEMDFGTFKASVRQGYEYGPIMIGPFPVTAEIGLEFTAEARFAMGYDTRGLREVLVGGNTVKLFKGLYIADYNAQGVDVDEWKLTFRIYAEAALDLVIVEAGIYGGIDTILSGNLRDPKPDGKIYFDEVWEDLSNPICLFDISGKMQLFLGVYLEVDLFFWSDRWELEIVRLTLLDFTTGCKGTDPDLAYVDNQGNLVLNIGDEKHRNARGIQRDEINEEFTVRQVGDGKFSVEAFGLKEDVPDAKEIEAGKLIDMAKGRVIADADAGNDIIALVAGAVTVVANGEMTTTQVAFTLGSYLTGGQENDSLTGGDGDDRFFGGPGADRLIGGDGGDEIFGEGGNDRIDGGLGVDTLNGGGEDDVVTGGPGGDTIIGGDGKDSLLGGPWSPGSPDTPKPYLKGRDGIDKITGGLGDDFIDGGPDNDLLWGDELLDNLSPLGCEDTGTTGGNDTILGGPGNDTLVGGYGNDRLIGNSGHVDELWPYSDNDRLCGNAGADTLDGDDEDPAYDKSDYNDGAFVGGLWGGPGDDIMYGRGDNDEMNGGTGEDYMEGNAGVDTMNGDAGQDDMIGGSSMSGQPDEGDIMHGGDDQDVMAGDNASISRPGGIQTDGTITRTVLLYDLNTASGDSTIAGMDTMDGDGDNDDMYGGGENDTMHGNAGQDYMRGGADNDTMRGNAHNDEMYGDSGNDIMQGNENDDTMRGNTGDDYMEGNGGVDTMYGDADQDDMIGGSAAAEQTDEGDIMYGNAHHDVMAGDNATITRPGGEEIDGTIVRNVTLHDLPSGNSDTNNAGADDMQGDDGNDDMYGGGENDVMNGNAGDDMIEGNGGTDILYGDAGQDDLIGGTSQGGGGQPDAADTIYGGSIGLTLADDFDVITGDNASIVRAQNGGVYVTDNFAPDTMGVVRRIITLFDVATTTTPAPANTSGGDTLFGEDGFDIMYGQGSNEVGMSGGGGNDEMYGNDGDDVMLGNDGQDDMVGGTGRTKSDDPASATDGRLDGVDAITGGSGTPDADANDYDVIMGDNATIFKVFKVLDGNGAWVVNTFNAAITRNIRHYDVGTVVQTSVVGASGGDLLSGEDNDDIMYGQGGNDLMRGGNGDDHMEGNANDTARSYPDCQGAVIVGDLLYGEQGQDDLIGGTSRTVSDRADSAVDGRLDGDDTIYGGDCEHPFEQDFDVIAGDNASITRVLDANGLWMRNTFNNAYTRIIHLLDVGGVDSSVSVETNGDDRLFGEANDDIVYGQGGNDLMRGGVGQDYMEGNADSAIPSPTYMKEKGHLAIPLSILSLPTGERA